MLLLLGGAFSLAALLVPEVRANWLSYSAAFMWTPGIAALFATLLSRRNLHGLGWGWGHGSFYAFAYLFPVVFCLPVYAVAWLTPLGGFDVAALEAQRARFGAAGLIAMAAASPFLGVLATLGEELGWRGFLVPRLLEVTTFTRTSLIVGILWALWHYPVTIAVLPRYLPGLPIAYALACFTISVIAISFVYTWLRIRSESVWPCALLHASSNALMAACEASTVHGRWTSYWTYEYGAGFAIVLPILIVILARWSKR